METVGVIGAGVMGRGVAVAVTRAGLRCVLVDVSEEVLDRSRVALTDDVRAAALLAPGAPLSVDDVLARIAFTTKPGDLAEADIVVENATERWSVKKPIYLELGGYWADGAILGVNTSAIPITRLASLTARPADVIGMHFMNPVPLKPTVELIRGYHTSAATVERAQQFLAGIGKRGIVVNDSPGFVTNRVMMLTVNEAVFLLQEGVATAAEIDRLFVECFGHSMGPLATADLIGLDTVLYSIEVLYEEFRDDKYRPCPLLVRMVDAGLHGRKSGQGFFDYRRDAGRRAGERRRPGAQG
jgi:3-hydroxybutyryl-CoA dehydrogenase